MGNVSRLGGSSPFVFIDGVSVVPLGEYLLNIGKLLEVLITQNPTLEMLDAFINCGAAQKLISLLKVKNMPWAISQSVFPQHINNIFRYLLVCIFLFF